MQYFIENNDKNIKNNLVLFLLELIINLFSSINIDVSSNVSLIIYEQKINLNSELYKEIILQKAHPIVRVGLPDVSDFFYKYANKYI